MAAVNIFFSIVCMATIAATTNAIGVNWGSQMSHPIDPKIVVKMLAANGINKVKLFNVNPRVMNAFAGSSIEVAVAIPNDDLARMSEDYGNAEDWVNDNVVAYDRNGQVLIAYVAVGNEPFLKSYNGSYLKTTLPAMNNIQQALNEAGVGDRIKVIIPLDAAVCGSPSDNPVPSAGEFRSDIHDLMVDVVRFLNENDAPFVVNLYPFLSLQQNENFPVDFAFFDGGNRTLKDKSLQYDNVFDVNYDTLIWALRKAGVGDMKIVVGQVGWPTDGDLNATVTQAKRFYHGFLKKLAAKKGTPLRPGIDLEVYLFALIDEDMKSIVPGNFERHWGIFQYDGQPKFPMDLSGEGSNSKCLIAAQGVKYLPKQWCVFNAESKSDENKTPFEVTYACRQADCTPIDPGGSCISLDANSYSSYAFNIYYQTRDQDVQACNFDGLAKVVTVDPSVPWCRFPIQIVSGGRNAGVRVGVLVVVVAVGVVMVLL